MEAETVSVPTCLRWQALLALCKGSIACCAGVYSAAAALYADERQNGISGKATQVRCDQVNEARRLSGSVPH